MQSGNRPVTSLDPLSNSAGSPALPLANPFATLTSSAGSEPITPARPARSSVILAASDPLSLSLRQSPQASSGSNGALQAMRPSGTAVLPATANAVGQRSSGGGLNSSTGTSRPASRKFGRCSCPACTGSARSVLIASTTSASGTATAAPTAAVGLQTLANYLTTGFWQEGSSYTRRYNLSSSGTGAKGGTLTYNITGWANDTNGLSADRQALAREVFKTYSAVMGINFKEVTGAGGDLRFTDNDSGAYAYLASGWYDNASGTSATIEYSVINVETSWYDGQSNYNTYTPQTFFHEIGHALGLGHQGQYNYTGSPLTYSSSAQFANDSWQATMMSYWDQSQNPTTGSSFAWLQTPMAVDWIALNDLYGGQGFGTANAFKGDTIYGVGTNISAAVSKIWNEFSIYAGVDAYTLVDGSGYDTLDVSNFTANQLINLAPSQTESTAPSRSNIGGKIGNLTIAANTIIEAAISGNGNDIFYGNDAANTFRGGGGNDSFYDSIGSDIYHGDAGNDWFYFGESLNLFSYSLSGNALRFSRLSGSADIDLVWNSTENFSFNNVTYTYQQLVDGLGTTTLPAVTIQTVNGSLASGAFTNATELRFQGSLSRALSSGESIIFFRNGVEVGSASPVAEGSTSWSFDYQEASGTNSVTYTARVLVAASGATGTFSNSFRLTIDTEAPLVGVNSLDSFSTTPLLSGSVSDPSAQVSISIGSLTRTATNNGNGSWSLQWTDPLAADQTYDVVARATDAAGNSGTDTTSGELTVRADDYSANSSTTGLVSMGGSSSGNLEFNGDHDWFGVDLQLGGTYVIQLNGTTLVDPYLRLYSANGSLLANNDDASLYTLNSLISFTANSTGRFYLDAGAYNDAGSGTYSLSVNQVITLPSVTIQTVNGSLTSGASTNATALRFQGSLSRALSSGESIVFFRNGVEVGNASPVAEGSTSWAFDYQEASGTNSVTYTARVEVAASGTTGAFSSGFQLTIDTEAPLVSVNSLDTFSTTPLLSGSVSDPSARVSVSIGSITRTAINNGNGSWSLQWTDALRSGQTYDVVARATDAAGNSSSDTTSGELTLRADDYSATSSTTGLVSVGGSSNGNLEINGDHDWFGVNLQLGRTYEFRLNGTTLVDPSLRLYSATGSLLASNDDASLNTLNSLISFTANSTGRFYLDAGAYNEAGSGTYSLSVSDITPAPTFYFSLANSITSASASVMGGLTARTNDILSFNGSTFSVWLNGNASGLTGAVLRDFDIINPNEVVVAFNARITLSGIAFDPADLARLTRTSTGFAISMAFDGSDVGLTTTAEAIDAVTGLPDGSWLISTRGGGSVPSGTGNLNFAAEDLLRFVPTSLGANTAGSWSLYADLSNVGLTTTNNNPAENVVAVDVTATGRVVMASQGNASASGLQAANEDAFAWQPTRFGTSTAGSFLSPLVFDGSNYGLGSNALMGIDLPA